MNRRRSAVVWGLVGSLSFLVLHQAYLLVLGGRFVGFLPVLAIAAVVGAVATAAAYALEPRLATYGRRVDEVGDDGRDGKDRGE